MIRCAKIRSAPEKAPHLIDEAAPGWIALEDQVVVAFQRHEARAGYARRHAPSLLERLHGIVAAVQNQRWHAYAGQKVADINAVFVFSSRRRHTRCYRDGSSDVCSSDLASGPAARSARRRDARRDRARPAAASP